MKTLIGSLLQYLTAYVIQMMWYLFPVRRNVIMFYAHDRKGLACNPKYLMQELQKRNPGRWILVWASDYPESVKAGKGVRVVGKRSLRYYFYFSRARLFVTNDMADAALIKKRGQIFINTWHGGGAFKRVGFDMKAENGFWRRLLHNWKFERWYGRMDYMLAPSAFLVKRHAKAFGLKEEQMLRFGMPRCGVLLRENSFYRDIREAYGMKGDTKILLYAPTFREKTGNAFLKREELELLLDACRHRFGGTWACMIRMHDFMHEAEKLADGSVFYDGSCHEDVQELLGAADVLLSDYSSLIWDYSLLGRPIFCYGSDVKEYEAERGFYLSFAKWPYPKAYDVQGLVHEIENFDERKFAEDLKRHEKRLGSYEDGNAAEKMAEFLETLV